MQRLERGRNGVHSARPGLERATAQLPEIAALEEFHDKEGPVLHALEPVDLHQVLGGNPCARATSPSSRATRGASAARESSKNLSATRSPRVRSTASQTSALPPRPIRRASTNRAPSSSPGVSSFIRDQPVPLDCAAVALLSAAGATGAVGTRPVSSL